ncbi:MAG TPA: FecR domain-containing protein [Steroidobacteraceae bacterium]|nr:FecR domain-containing protein [Steroidobacteraceae bacterium]
MSSETDLRAAQWVARSQAGELSALDRAELERWLAADTAHAVAFARAEYAWERAGRLEALPRRALEPATATGDGAHRAPWNVTLGRIGWLAAAVLAGLMAGGSFWFYAGQASAYETAVGERRTVPLKDGSEVNLNTETRLRVVFRRNERDIFLEHGEALFKVAHDMQRPFIVHTAEAEVRAVGTAFNVRLRRQMAEVTVTEGTVRLRSGEDAQAGTEATEAAGEAPPGVSGGREQSGRHIDVLLSAGSAAVAAGGAIRSMRLAADVLRRRTAWRDGVIELNGETLTEAVEEFNRYRKTGHISVEPALGGLRVGGRFATNEADQFIRALQTQFSVRSVQGADGEIFLMGGG